jgi:hypothetical protein
MERLRVKLGGEFPNPPLFYEISNLRLALTEQRSRVHGRKSVWGHRIKAGALIAPVAKIRSRNLKLRQRRMNPEGDSENCGQCDRRTAAQVWRVAFLQFTRLVAGGLLKQLTYREAHQAVFCVRGGVIFQIFKIEAKMSLEGGVRHSIRA